MKTKSDIACVGAQTMSRVERIAMMLNTILTDNPQEIKMPPADTQEGMILAHLDEHGSITALDAIDYGIMRLAARISDLKKRGFDIVSKNEIGKNRYGDTVHYTRYYLGGDDK